MLYHLSFAKLFFSSRQRQARAESSLWKSPGVSPEPPASYLTPNRVTSQDDLSKKQGKVNIKLIMGLAVVLTLTVVGLVVTIIEGEQAKSQLSVIEQELSQGRFYTDRLLRAC